MAHRHRKMIIIGAGFGGLTMAIKLKREGIEDFIILERADDVGGAWYHNTYPGCRCDVPSHLYSLSFAPNPNWSNTFSPQEEIRDYLQDVADRFGIRPHLQTGTDVESATWLDDSGIWEVETSNGTFTSSMLVSSAGPLTEPLYPDLPGLADFEGKAMHSARWDHDYDLTGKRVASIGTGASAIQYVPEIAKSTEQLFVFQRTAPWVLPHTQRLISEREHRLFRHLPAAQRAIRGGVYAAKELLVLGLAKWPKLMDHVEKMARAHIEKQVPDSELRAKVTPDYEIGCKRMVPSNRWYPALAEPNVELVTGGASEVRANSVVDSEGVEREVDAIIFGTGFHVTDIPMGDHIRGRSGVRLNDFWEGSPRAYLGTSMPGFPNLFMLLGPNTGNGHTSMVYMIESQVEHVLRAVEAMERTGNSTIEVRPEPYAAFNRTVDRRMKGTVWETGGCSSFYIDRTGRNATIWPDFTWRFRHKATNGSMDAYELGVPARKPVPV